MNASPLNHSPPNDDTSARPSSQLFTVRIWSERSEQGVIAWRGKVQAVPNGAWRYFHDWLALTAFLQTQISEPTTESQQPSTNSAGSLGC